MVIKPGGKYWNEADVHTHPLLQLVSVHHSQYKVNTWETDCIIQQSRTLPKTAPVAIICMAACLRCQDEAAMR